MAYFSSHCGQIVEKQFPITKLFLFIVIIPVSFLFSSSVYAAVKAYQVATPMSQTLPYPYENVRFNSRSITVNIDPANTKWIALSCMDYLADLPTGDNGNIPPDGFVDIAHPNVDDYIVVRVKKGSEVEGIWLDRNDAYNCRAGNQAVLYGSYQSVRAVDCVDFTQNPPVTHSATFQESGELTDFFNLNGEGEYIFTFDFYNAYTPQVSNGNIWLLMDVAEETNAPEIILEPADYPWFQVNILLGEGFVIRIRDEDGIKDNDGDWMLDWATLRFYLNGVDISSHFVTTALNNNIITWAETKTEKEISFFVKPDPQKFMSQHDVFGIPWNGNHSLSLSICDISGLCDSTDYEIYFGPFVLVGSVTDILCYEEEFSWLYFDYVALGNIGIDSGKNIVYLVLNKKGTCDYISHTEFGWVNGIKPANSGGMSIPTGYYIVLSDFIEKVPSSMNGELIYFFAVMDEESGAYQIDREEFDFNCGSQ